MLQEKVNSLKQIVQDDLKKGEDTIFNGLVASVVPKKIPEPLFKSYFLPGFMGTNPNPNWMLEWISISGSPSAEVSVFDPNTGEELFRVPPVLASRNILAPKDGPGLDDIFKRHSMMSGGLGSSGTTFLHSALADKSNQIFSNYKNDSDDRWFAIMARYGIVPAGQVAKNQNNPDDEMFDY